ncbi:MAG TPA: hypothetical protein VN612_16505 [Acidobacteriaceae bacterium]|nr:hypothetical protein [Acidobacteriaceae bacterium]
MSFSGIEQWLLAQIVPVFSVGFALLAGLALVYFSAQSRKAARQRDRAGQNEDTFTERLAVYGFDVELARAVYRYLEQRTGVGFPILPNDDLDRDLGLDREDAMDALRELNAQVGREYLPGLVQTPLVTVADLLRAVQGSPRKVLPMRRKA